MPGTPPCSRWITDRWPTPEPQSLFPSRSSKDPARRASLKRVGSCILSRWQANRIRVEQVPTQRQRHLREINGGEDPSRLTRGAGPVCFPTWSPDGGHAYQGCSSGSCGTFIVPALGGPERKLASESACLGLSWSPDGKFLTFPAKDSAAEPWHIAVFSLDTMDQRRVTSPPANVVGDHHPSFSPDSKTVAFTRLSSPSVTDIHLASIQDGQTRRLTFDKTVIGGSAWDAEAKVW